MTELDVEPWESRKPALAWCPAQNAESKSQSEWTGHIYLSGLHSHLHPSVLTLLGWSELIFPAALLVPSLTSGSVLGVLRFYMLPFLSRKTLQTKSKDAQILILREGVIDRKSNSTAHVLVILPHSPMRSSHPFLYSKPTSSGFPCPLIPHLKSFSDF